MPVTDVHAHYVSRSIVDRIAAGELPFATTAVRDDVDHVVIDGLDPRPIGRRLSDLTERISWMDENGIDRQIVGTLTDLFAYHLGLEEARLWALTLDGTLLDDLRPHGGRFAALATPPLQHPGLAVEHLEWAADEGAVGALIGTRVGERELDDAELWPVWEVARDLGLAVLVHPEAVPGPRLDLPGLGNAVGRPLEATLAAARLLVSGTIERFPGLRIVLSHGGAALPALLGRLQRNHELFPGPADPRESFGRLYFDSVVHGREFLEHLCRLASPNHVLLGSDYPYPIGDLQPTRTVRSAAISDDQAQAILRSGDPVFTPGSRKDPRDRP